MISLKKSFALLGSSWHHLIAFRLPFPPTVNSIWRISGHRGNYLSDKAKAFYINAGHVIRNSDWEKFSPLDSLLVRIDLFNNSKVKFDVDNRAKAVLDLLQRQAIYHDDAQVIQLLMKKHPPVVGDAYCLVEVSKLD